MLKDISAVASTLLLATMVSSHVIYQDRFDVNNIKTRRNGLNPMHHDIGLTNLKFLEKMRMDVVGAQALPNLPALTGQLGLNQLVAVVKAVGLVDALSQPGPFTVFGPTDQAFAMIPAAVKKEIEMNTTLLKEVVEYHVLMGKVMSSQIKDELTVKTLQGSPLRFNIYNSNTITAQCSKIDLSKVDQQASNGVVHELTRVMLPPLFGNIATTASAFDAFSTLLMAVDIAGIGNVLANEGPFTLYAPTNDAFAKIPTDTLNKILANKTLLTSILTYHVTNLTYCSTGLMTGDYPSVKTLNGKNITISLNQDTIKVNDATILPGEATDISVTNGVIHTIDTVLLPPNFSLA